jgi:hypothetical protein
MSIKKIVKKSIFSFILVAIIAILPLCATAASAQAVPNGNVSAVCSAADMTFRLIQIQADVQGSLNDLDSDVANASQDLSATGLEGDAARGVLSKLMETNSNLVEAVTFSKNGTIIVAECKDCVGGEGADISSQEHIDHILKDKTPAFSNEFLLVEGYNGTALAYPVFSPQGEFLGGISTIIKPDNFINAVVAPKLNGTNYSIFVMQDDGLIIYSSDANQIGNNLLEDPLYKPFPGLLTLVRRMVDERSGYGTYEFQVTADNKTVVTKEAYWTTTRLHGRDWRLAIYRIIM